MQTHQHDVIEVEVRRLENPRPERDHAWFIVKVHSADGPTVEHVLHTKRDQTLNFMIENVE